MSESEDSSGPDWVSDDEDNASAVGRISLVDGAQHSSVISKHSTSVAAVPTGGTGADGTAWTQPALHHVTSVAQKHVQPGSIPGSSVHGQPVGHPTTTSSVSTGHGLAKEMQRADAGASKSTMLLKTPAASGPPPATVAPQHKAPHAAIGAGPLPSRHLQPPKASQPPSAVAASPMPPPSRPPALQHVPGSALAGHKFPLPAGPAGVGGVKPALQSHPSGKPAIPATAVQLQRPALAGIRPPAAGGPPARPAPPTTTGLASAAAGLQQSGVVAGHVPPPTLGRSGPPPAVRSTVPAATAVGPGQSSPTAPPAARPGPPPGVRPPPQTTASAKPPAIACMPGPPARLKPQVAAAGHAAAAAGQQVLQGPAAAEATSGGSALVPAGAVGHSLLPGEAASKNDAAAAAVTAAQRVVQALPPPATVGQMQLSDEGMPMTAVVDASDGMLTAAAVQPRGPTAGTGTPGAAAASRLSAGTSSPAASAQQKRQQQEHRAASDGAPAAITQQQEQQEQQRQLLAPHELTPTFVPVVQQQQQELPTAAASGHPGNAQPTSADAMYSWSTEVHEHTALTAATAASVPESAIPAAARVAAENSGEQGQQCEQLTGMAATAAAVVPAVHPATVATIPGRSDEQENLHARTADAVMASPSGEAGVHLDAVQVAPATATSGYVVAAVNPFASAGADNESIDDLFGSSISEDVLFGAAVAQPAVSSNNSCHPGAQLQQQHAGPSWGPPPPVATAVTAATAGTHSTASSTGSTCAIAVSVQQPALPQPLQQAAPDSAHSAASKHITASHVKHSAAGLVDAAAAHGVQPPFEQHPKQQADSATEAAMLQPVESTIPAAAAAPPPSAANEAVPKLVHDVSLATWARPGNDTPTAAQAAEAAAQAWLSLDAVQEEPVHAPAATTASVHDSKGPFGALVQHAVDDDGSAFFETVDVYGGSAAAGGLATFELQLPHKHSAAALFEDEEQQQQEQQQQKHTAEVQPAESAAEHIKSDMQLQQQQAGVDSNVGAAAAASGPASSHMEDSTQELQTGATAMHTQQQEHQLQQGDSGVQEQEQQQQQVPAGGSDIAPGGFRVVSKPLFADEPDADDSAFFSTSPTGATVAATAVPVDAMTVSQPMHTAAAYAQETAAQHSAAPAVQQQPDHAYQPATGPLFEADDDSSAFFTDDNANIISGTATATAAAADAFGMHPQVVQAAGAAGEAMHSSQREQQQAWVQPPAAAPVAATAAGYVAAAAAPWSNAGADDDASAFFEDGFDAQQHHALLPQQPQQHQVPAAAQVSSWHAATNDDASAFFDEVDVAAAPLAAHQHPHPWQQQQQQPEQQWSRQQCSSLPPYAGDYTQQQQYAQQPQQQQQVSYPASAAADVFAPAAAAHGQDDASAFFTDSSSAGPAAATAAVAAVSTAAVQYADDDASAFFDDGGTSPAVAAVQPVPFSTAVEVAAPADASSTTAPITAAVPAGRGEEAQAMQSAASVETPVPAAAAAAGGASQGAVATPTTQLQQQQPDDAESAFFTEQVQPGSVTAAASAIDPVAGAGSLALEPAMEPAAAVGDAAASLAAAAGDARTAEQPQWESGDAPFQQQQQQDVAQQQWSQQENLQQQQWGQHGYNQQQQWEYNQQQQQWSQVDQYGQQQQPYYGQQQWQQPDPYLQQQYGQDQQLYSQYGQQQQQQHGGYDPTQQQQYGMAATDSSAYGIGVGQLQQQQQQSDQMFGIPTRPRQQRTSFTGSTGSYLPQPQTTFMPMAPTTAAAGGYMPAVPHAATRSSSGGGAAGFSPYIPQSPAPMGLQVPESAAAVNFGVAAVPSYQPMYSGAAAAAPTSSISPAPYTSAGGKITSPTYSSWGQQSTAYGAQQPTTVAAAPAPDASALAAYAAAAPPLNMLEARRSPHGRPPCCFVVFGVGGRAVLQQPSVHTDMDISFATMGAGLLHFASLQQLPAMLKAVAAGGANNSGISSVADRPGTAPGLPASDITGPVCSLAAINKLVDSYPGPLGSNSNKDKCMKFIKDRIANCQADECRPDAPAWQVDGKKALWELLLLLAKNDGQLKASAGGNSGGSKGAAAAVGGLLQKAVGVGNTADGDSNTATAGSPAKGAAASAASDAADCELLKVLAPGVVSAASAGQRLLAAQVPEVELQATAAEMQRLLLLGRRQEALGAALAGQLWAPALILAHSLGESKFHEVAASMAQRGLIRGTPLRTLALLLSNRPDLVHEGNLAAAHFMAGVAGSGSIVATSSGGVGGAVAGLPSGGAGHSYPAPPGAGGLGGSALPGTQGSAVVSPGSLGLPAVHVPAPGFGSGSGSGATGPSAYTPSGTKRASTTGFFSPVAGGVGAGDVLLSQWRENLAIMASNRTAADAEPIMKMGDRLLQEQGQLEAAHMCYLVAGCLPTPIDAGPACRLVLLGLNHHTTAGRRAMAQLLPLLRTELYEWARGLAGDAQAWLPLLPYKLQMAALLADYGHVSRALSYCAAIDAALRPYMASSSKSSNAPGSTIPPLLLVLASQLEALKERLSVHAAAHNIRVMSTESALGKVGKFLDRAINKMMWGDQQPVQQMTPAATAAARMAAGPSVVDASGAGYGSPGGFAAAAAGGPGMVATTAPGPPSWILQQQQQQQMVGSPGAAAAAVARKASWGSLFGAGGVAAAGSGFSSPVAGVPPAAAIASESSASALLTGAGVVPGNWAAATAANAPVPAGDAVAGISGPDSSSVQGQSFAQMPGSTTVKAVGGVTAPSAAVNAAMGWGSHHQRSGSNLSLQSFASGQNMTATATPGTGTVSAGHSRTPSHDMTAPAAAEEKQQQAKQQGSQAATTADADSSAPPKVADKDKAGTDKASKSRNSSAGGAPGGKRWFGLGRLIGGSNQPQVASLGLENEFYYDEKRKRWVQRGHEDDVPDEKPPAPPPTSFTSAAAGGSSSSSNLAGGGSNGSSNSLAAQAGSVVSGPPPPPVAAATAGSGGPSSTSGPSLSGPQSSGPNSFTLKRPSAGGVGSRYVSTFASNSTSTAAAAAVGTSTSNGSSSSSNLLPGGPGLPVVPSAPGIAVNQRSGGSLMPGSEPPSGGFFIPPAPVPVVATAAADGSVAETAAVVAGSGSGASAAGADQQPASQGSDSIAGAAAAAGGQAELAAAAAEEASSPSLKQSQQQQQQQQPAAPAPGVDLSAGVNPAAAATANTSHRAGQQQQQGPHLQHQAAAPAITGASNGYVQLQQQSVNAATQQLQQQQQQGQVWGEQQQQQQPFGSSNFVMQGGQQQQQQPQAAAAAASGATAAGGMAPVAAPNVTYDTYFAAAGTQQQQQQQYGHGAAAYGYPGAASAASGSYDATAAAGYSYGYGYSHQEFAGQHASAYHQQLQQQAGAQYGYGYEQQHAQHPQQQQQQQYAYGGPAGSYQQYAGAAAAGFVGMGSGAAADAGQMQEVQL